MKSRPQCRGGPEGLTRPPARARGRAGAPRTGPPPLLERPLERLLFASRWLFAPFCLGLVAALALLLVKFLQDLGDLAPRVLALKATGVIAAVLSLLDLTLAASLVLMVILAGYESFVGHIGVAGDDRLAWMGRLDLGGLKLKLMGSVVAISAIELLKAFVDVASTDKADLAWLVAVHLAFVVSTVLLALADYLGSRSGAPKA